MMPGFFTYDIFPQIVIVLVDLVLIYCAIRWPWAAWKGFHAWQVEHERKRLENERQRADVALVTVRPGEIRVARSDLAEVVAAQFRLALANVEMMRLPANVPHSIHYAPHALPVERPALPGPVLGMGPPIVEADKRDWWQLYHADELPEDGYMLGWNTATGEKLIATWQELYNVLVGGLPRSGKSTLIRSVLAQAALQGSRFVVLDKHFGAGEDSMGASLLPLRPLMLTDIAATESQMLDALRLVRNVAEARLSGKDKDKTPLVLVTDETTGLLVRSGIAKELIDLLGLLTQESAKVKVFAICIGHQWKSEILPTEVRNSFVSSISTRARQDTARVMSGSLEFAKVAADLKSPGEAVWQTPAGDIIRLAIPNCTAHHIELVAREVSTGVWTVPKMLPEVEPRTEPRTEPRIEDVDDGSPAVDVTLLVDPTRAALVRGLIKAGKLKAEILREVWSVESKTGGEKFRLASREYDAVVRALIQ
jgi:hypothetical protein